MPASVARTGFGTTISLGSTAATPVYTALAEVTDITPPSDSIDIIEVTHMTSPNSTREYIAGLSDPGECSFTINFVPGVGADVTLQGLRTSRVTRKWRITFPNSVTWDFEGFLTGYTPTIPTNDKMTADVTIKVTGSYIPTGTPT